MFCVARPTHAGEPRLARREGVGLGIVPAARVAFGALLTCHQWIAFEPWRWRQKCLGLQRQHQRIAFGADRLAVVVGQGTARCDV